MAKIDIKKLSLKNLSAIGDQLSNVQPTHSQDNVLTLLIQALCEADVIRPFKADDSAIKVAGSKSVLLYIINSTFFPAGEGLIASDIGTNDTISDVAKTIASKLT